jgi:hypothetical protein
MRIEFIRCKNRKTAKRKYPWALKIVKVPEGFMCFELYEDYEAWKNK